MTKTMERQVESRLADRGVRFTGGRRRVVAVLAAADGPLSAAELHDVLDREVPLSTVYRTLSVLEEAGVTSPHLGAKGLTRYELAEWLSGHHHHLVCLACGAVDDVHLAPQTESELERLVGSAVSGDFVAQHHTLEIEGRCGRCA